MCRRLGHVLRPSRELVFEFNPLAKSERPREAWLSFSESRGYRVYTDRARTRTSPLLPLPSPTLSLPGQRSGASSKLESRKECGNFRWNDPTSRPHSAAAKFEPVGAWGSLLMTPESTAEVCFRVLEHDSKRSSRTGSVVCPVKPFRKQPAPDTVSPCFALLLRAK